MIRFSGQQYTYEMIFTQERMSGIGLYQEKKLELDIENENLQAYSVGKVEDLKTISHVRKNYQINKRHTSYWSLLSMTSLEAV
jgi:hypothetical protein